MYSAILNKMNNLHFSYTLNGSRVDVPITGDETTFERGGVSAKWTLRKVNFGYTAHLTLKFDRKVTLDAFSPLTAEIETVPGTRTAVTDRVFSGFANLSECTDGDSGELYLFKDGEGFMARSVYPLDFEERWKINGCGNTAQVELSITPPESYVADTYESPDVYIAAGKLSCGLEEFFTLLPQLWHGQKPVVGYNTWDYYFTDISEECVEENLRVIENNPEMHANLKYFTLDDGWQAIQGDWYANFRFPHGLKAAAARIRAAGLLPGIWSAPMHVWTLCSYAMRRMTGYLKNENGDPVQEDSMYVLDPTHPDTIEFIRELYTRLYEAGFRLYKVDYLRSIIRARRFYDPTCTQYEALRRLFRLIRECVHEDSVIVGCSLPAEAASPEADSGRTGIDIHTTWNHLCWCMEGFQHHWGENKRIWVNDVDFMLVRGVDTDNDDRRNVLDPNGCNPNHGRWRGGKDFTLDEARSEAAFVMLSGGSMNLSDRLAVLNDAGNEIIRKALTHRVEDSAIPQDQFMYDYPCIWKQGDRWIIINFFDEERTFTVSDDRTFTDLWTDRKFAASNGTLSVTLKPHESVVLE